jgi:hypothetical protein
MQNPTIFMSFSDIKKELNQLDKKQLISLISELYKINSATKEYLDFFANPNENEQHVKYKQRVLEAFYPKRGTDLKLKEAKLAIADFKKLGTSAELQADLMLFYVECGVRFTNDFGDINESFYSSLESMYKKALDLMHTENLLNSFQDRSLKIVKDTENIGWGFHYYIAGEHYEYYPLAYD